MTAPAPEALTLQRPLPADALRIVARGEKEDALREVAYTLRPHAASGGRYEAHGRHIGRVAGALPLSPTADMMGDG
jgi:hypothetical protein